MRLPVTSPPPSCPSPIHRDSQLALRAPSGGSDCKLNSPRLTLDSLLSSSLKRPLPGRAILPGDRCVCVVYNNKSPYLPQQNHSGFSITPRGIHFSPFLFHSDHALKALKSRLPPLPTLGLAEGTDRGQAQVHCDPQPTPPAGPRRATLLRWEDCFLPRGTWSWAPRQCGAAPDVESLLFWWILFAWRSPR